MFRNQLASVILLLFAALFGMQPNRALGQRLHLIIAANVIPAEYERDPDDWKEAANADAIAIQYVFEKHVHELNVVVIPATEMEARRVLQYINRLRVARNQDTVVFYYSGHGGRAGRPYFALNTRNSSTRLNRLDVYNAIAKHQPRLTVMLSDCCYSGPVVAVRPVTRANVTSRGFRALFFESRGLADITSSQPGEDSIVDPEFRQGVFTRQLVEVLEKHSGNASITWHQFFSDVEQETERRIRQLRQSRGWHDLTQTPFAFRLPGVMGMHLIRQLEVHDVWPGYPAAEAGIRVGDRIIAVDGRNVHDRNSYTQAVRSAGRDVRLTIRRGGAEQTVTVRR